MVINIPAVGAPNSAGNLVSFDVQLTRTGAMMGTPAYMAPEQFLGTPTDPRTDQFAFCIALYEALYGERPFAGNTMYSLTTNVVQGNVRPAPANTKVPGWIRKIVLRGLRPHADDRWPAMEDLLAALGTNPADARKKWVVAVGAPLRRAGDGRRNPPELWPIASRPAAADRRSWRDLGAAPARRRRIAAPGSYTSGLSCDG